MELDKHMKLQSVSDEEKDIFLLLSGHWRKAVLFQNNINMLPKPVYWTDLLNLVPSYLIGMPLTLAYQFTTGLSDENDKQSE